MTTIAATITARRARPDDQSINDIRERQKRNFLATLFFSHGTPMLLAGDEFGHGQSGQQQLLLPGQRADLAALGGSCRRQCRTFSNSPRRVIALRDAQPLLRRENWRDGMTVNWFNRTAASRLPEHWHDERHSACISNDLTSRTTPDFGRRYS